MNILVIGHSYIVDSNRQFWNQIAMDKSVKVDLIVPNKWNSNLIKELEFKFNPATDKSIASIYPVDCYFKGRASIYFFNWFKVYKIISNKKYDLVFVFQETWSLSVAQISLLKFFSKNKCEQDTLLHKRNYQGS